MIKWLVLTFTITLAALTAYSQTFPKSIVIENDSCIVFTLEQSKKMIEWDIEKDLCKTELDIAQSEISLKDSIINNQVNQLNEFQGIESAYEEIIIENDLIRNIFNEEREILQKQLKKERRRKWLSSTLGIVATTVATVLWITK
jgi:hypothetical protein